MQIALEVLWSPDTRSVIVGHWAEATDANAIADKTNVKLTLSQWINPQILKFSIPRARFEFNPKIGNRTERWHFDVLQKKDETRQQTSVWHIKS